jgi:hypothetical protein
MAETDCRWECPEDWWAVERLAGSRTACLQLLGVLLVGMLFAHGRRTVTTWLRAAGVSVDYQDYYHFLAALGRKIELVATQLDRNLSWPRSLVSLAAAVMIGLPAGNPRSQFEIYFQSKSRTEIFQQMA